MRGAVERNKPNKHAAKRQVASLDVDQQSSKTGIRYLPRAVANFRDEASSKARVEYAKHPPTRIIGADWEVHFRVENISSNLRRAFDAGDATIYMPGTKAPVEEAFTQQAVVQARQLPNAARNSNLVYLFMCFADRPTHLYGKRNTRPRGAEKMVTCNEVR